MIPKIRNTFLSLVRFGIGTGAGQEFLPLKRIGELSSEQGGAPHKGDSADRVQSKSLNPDEWVQLKELADEQGLTAVALDGLNALKGARSSKSSSSSNGIELPLELELQWNGEVIQNYENVYPAYRDAITSLAKWHNEHGFKMMVLKGYACSLDWPKPDHRPCGDIDIWQFGKQKEADAALDEWFKGLSVSPDSSSVQKFKIDGSLHHHTVFNWGDFMVENHYDFVHVQSHKVNRDLERLLKQQGEDDSHFVEIDGTKVYLPSTNLHALFLLVHAMGHFAASAISLRQLVDWGMFAQKHSPEVDWNWLESILELYGMKRLYDIFNAICVEDLGFDINIFPQIQFESNLKERVLNEIIFPAIPNDIPHRLFKRIVWKFHRWKANEWKHQLVYKESMWSSFWNGAWSHLLKPESI